MSDISNKIKRFWILLHFNFIQVTNCLNIRHRSKLQETNLNDVEMQCATTILILISVIYEEKTRKWHIKVRLSTYMIMEHLLCK